MKSTSKLWIWTSAAAFLLVSVACDNTAQGIRRDAEENKKEAAEITAEARAKAEVGAEKAADVAEKAGEAIADATRTATNATGSAVQTMDVKAALIADKRIDARGIDVDTDYATKMLVLKGHVPSAAQKTLAEEIAVAKAAGYHVRNELTVR